jgi:hypothetical protein
VIQNAEVLYPYHEHLRGHLCELIKTSDKPQDPFTIERIVKASATVVNWCYKSANEGPKNNQEESLGYCKLIFGRLHELVRQTTSQPSETLPPAEQEQLLTDILKIIRTILRIFPVGALDAPREDEQSVGSETREVPLPLRLFELNVAYLMVKFGNVELDQKML